MPLKIKPPTHRVDAGGVFISAHDCWDLARIDREIQAFQDRALAEVQEKAVEAFLAEHPGGATDEQIEEIKTSCRLTDQEVDAARARHPWARYLAGKTRFQPTAPDWDHEGRPCAVRDYLLGEPTEFQIRRLSYQQFQALGSTLNTRMRLTEACRVGLRAIRSPSPDWYSWTAKRDEDRAPDDVLQALHEASLGLIGEIGAAVINYNAPLSADEGKR